MNDGALAKTISLSLSLFPSVLGYQLSMRPLPGTILKEGFQQSFALAGRLQAAQRSLLFFPLALPLLKLQDAFAHMLPVCRWQ